MPAFFDLLLRTFILSTFYEQTGGSPGNCNSGSGLKKLGLVSFTINLHIVDQVLNVE